MKLINLGLGIGSIVASLVGFAITGNPAKANSLLQTFSNPGQVGTIDTSTGVFTPVIIDAPQLTDIALSEDKELFGVTFNQLFSLDLDTNASTLIGNLGASINGLDFDNNDVLYGTGGSNFYSIDTNSGLATQIANIPNFLSAGDIVFNPGDNKFLGTSGTPNNSTLFSIALDGTATEIGDIGFSNVFGLFFENQTLYGYTANREQIVIDKDTGIGTFDKNITGTSRTIGGAASLPSTGPVTVPEPGILLGLLGLCFAGLGTRIKLQSKA